MSRDEILRRFAECGPRTAIADADRVVTYRELAERVGQVRIELGARGIAPGGVVILNADYSRESVAALLALYLERAIVVPVVTLTPRVRDAIVDCCGPAHVVTPMDGGLTVERLDGASVPGAALGQLDERGAAGLVLLSSGSTGTPKAILHDFDSLVADKLRKRVRSGASVLNILMVLLFDHIGGVNSLLSTLLVGGTAILPRKRTPDEICALVERHRIRVLPTSPTFLNLIIVGGHHRTYDLSSLRLITYGTESMPDELLGRVAATFPGVRLLQTFGTSETGICSTTSESSRSTYFRISDANVRYRIVDGELELKSGTQFLGYLNEAGDALTEDGWFRTGDLAEENADGYIRIRGRAREVINVGGEKVLPLELESALLASPLVEDCVVYGRANAITGQSVCVDVKPSRPMTRAELRRHVVEFLTGRVERFKIPSKVNPVETVDVSERGKKIRRPVPGDIPTIGE